MASEGADNGSIPRFSFGEFALSEEPDRRLPDRLVPEFDLNIDINVNEDIDQMRRKLVQEQHSPEILPCPRILVHDVRELVDHSLRDVEKLEDEASDSIEVHIKKMEIDRLNYVLRCYYRTRLRKIEKGIHQIMEQPSLYDRLSKYEKRYAEGYMDLLESHFKGSFLRKLPSRLRDLKNDKDGRVESIPKADLNRFVFIRAISNISNYVVSEE